LASMPVGLTGMFLDLKFDPGPAEKQLSNLGSDSYLDSDLTHGWGCKTARRGSRDERGRDHSKASSE
jgi:hypothetical protein